ncbi:hypothetical protein K493DRAFT_314767 [Basidiobolus meristosporus CBS 931.73]|uniref:Uncharacterized protein n=1 Tax=Basidiobolus meristosporus CBS 931.73 TaxID=1314790 RepID=A0A1Y1YE77_9FUNG|nr:hypothetical protein K493DRAFT_314767 [Basidiobolus meristosporus CBS 931.73]|eukprot:ORX95904.1 hypothetical protein K493DRAFT_314767 [Basidiobolus meristosporus CBS 931.73]
MSYTSRSVSSSPSPQINQDTAPSVTHPGNHETPSERKHHAIRERLTNLKKEFVSTRNGIFAELMSSLENEFRQVFEGEFEEYAEQIEDLEKICEEKILAAQLHRDHHLDQLEKDYEAELERAQQEYLKEKESLKERMLLQIEEKKKKLREDKDQLEINNDIAIEASARVHTTRRHRKRDAQHPEGRTSKRRHMTADVMILQLKEQDISQDVALIQKRTTESPEGDAASSHAHGATHRKSTTTKHRR